LSHRTCDIIYTIRKGGDITMDTKILNSLPLNVRDLLCIDIEQGIRNIRSDTIISQGAKELGVQERIELLQALGDVHDFIKHG
jgi:hypothetical protein